MTSKFFDKPLQARTHIRQKIPGKKSERRGLLVSSVLLQNVHHNPCQPHWDLATVQEAYRWSSAAFMSGGRTFDGLRYYNE
ncbi:MAG: hypothetical protein M3342_01355 [Bacteroidota bacterium]|nr:hypothetical protein [Bacteroidota bacterium]